MNASPINLIKNLMAPPLLTDILGPPVVYIAFHWPVSHLAQVVHFSENVFIRCVPE